MSIQHIVLILGVGIIAGFLNTTAGGGSLITMPLLVFLGLPSAVANGTNRIALMVQNITAISSFKSKGYFNWKLGLTFGLPAVFGSIIGSGIAVSLSDELFNKILAVVMILVLGLIIFQPQKKLAANEEELNMKKKIIGIIAFVFVGLYGGLIQAGVGFIIIAVLTLVTGFSLVRINSLKVFIVMIYMFSSLIVFIFNGKVDWVLGLVLSVGNATGAYLGSAFSVKKGDKWIKVVLSAAIIIMSMKLLGIFKF